MTCTLETVSIFFASLLLFSTGSWNLWSVLVSFSAVWVLVFSLIGNYNRHLYRTNYQRHYAMATAGATVIVTVSWVLLVLNTFLLLVHSTDGNGGDKLTTVAADLLSCFVLAAFIVLAYSSRHCFLKWSYIWPLTKSTFVKRWMDACNRRWHHWKSDVRTGATIP